ncbi:TPA: glutathione S-transferase family protein [Burkholderia aenigmatica]|uniref:glutathione S-transferase family protein n=1 Tax=Burkholderia sp. AU45251 TaxID=3059204 RepID=UPI00264B6564|nr:glutathione S-transferase family protein [Burkholderia sp. AU45251]HDR9483899.1 glutathione S-transferase family protein [Burkholderia aenigmatica]MDN7516157.1 glutathione S-transferase family protein [Burkholderia sp. AU45251]HDR9514864.1 glutathione S-transferase family protein [Burkholderia aenigmatica]HDR9591949.1 glutathione S-transferase family protein [Burkholderia aenigmatica]HDR9601275.1 glutathione S-transferase family protein [Burkholderia aenigmatica]
MQPDRHLILYHAPRSRSAGARMLLEELNADYELHTFDLSSGKHHDPDYLRTNPMGKVPALRHGDVIVTEQAAVYLYAAELYPEAGLSPAAGDALRGPYLRWMVFYGSCFEPAIVDRSMNRPPAPYATSPYGDFDAVVNAIETQLAKGPYLLGERLTAVDVLWGAALNWITLFKLMPETPTVRAYIDRILARPAIQRAQAADAALAAEQDNAKTAAAPAR